MLIRAKNNLTEIAQNTYLSSSVSAGAGTLPVQNIAGFNASWAIQLGRTGEQQSEIKLITASAPSGTALLTTAVTTYDQPQDTPVYAIKYDKMIFKRSTSGTAGTATAMTSGTVNITPNSSYTSFDDTTGASTYAYKVAFYNSVLDSTSSDSDWITPAGFSFFSLAKIRERIRGKLFDSSYIPSDDTINDWVNEWLEVMNNSAVNVNKDYSLGTTTVSYSGTAQLGTVSATDFKDVRKVEFTTDGNTYYQAQKKGLTEFSPNESFVATKPYFFYQGDNVLGRLPNDTSGTARIIYYKNQTVLVNDTDTLPVSMQPYTKSFVDYGLAQALAKDGKTSEAQLAENRAMAAKNEYVRQITPRSNTGPVFVESVEPLDGADSLYY